MRHSDHATHHEIYMVEQITVPIIKIWDTLSPDHLGESNFFHEARLPGRQLEVEEGGRGGETPLSMRMAPTSSAHIQFLIMITISHSIRILYPPDDDFPT